MGLRTALNRRFPVFDKLEPATLDAGLKTGIRESVATHAQSALTTGVFVVGLALQLGANNATIGLLAAIPFLSQLMQLPSIFIIERVRNRRGISVISMIVSRSFLFAIAATPLIPDDVLARQVLVVSLILYGTTGSVCSCAWSSWMRDLVPEDRMGWYYARRMFYGIGLALGIGLLASGFIDLWQAWLPDFGRHVYTVVFLAGGVMGFVDTWLIARMPEASMARPAKPSPLLKLLWQPFRDINFRRLLMFLVSWNFAINLAAPFFTVYMLTLLNMPMSLVIIMTLVSQGANVASVRVWGQMTDRFSNKAVLGVCAPLFIFAILGWTFTTFPDPHRFTFVLVVTLHVLMGISTAGVTLATSNIALKLSPRGAATSYLAANSIGNSLAAGTAPILGGLFADFFASQELSWILQWRSGDAEVVIRTLSFRFWDFFFFLAFLLGLYSIHRLSLVREVGEVQERVVIRELLSLTRRSFRNLSSVAGLRVASYFPFAVLREARSASVSPQEQETEAARAGENGS
ncbi:MAG: MFS transporter, partial [Alphaproteobacteria bacterium]